ncbi:MAG: hypothetical protein PVH88_06525 [Ignavibacteria bacterium]|jgi:hypothetical protein
MKLLVVITIEEYADVLRKIFRENKVPSYSETDVRNFKLFEDSDDSENWFGNHESSMDGHLFFTFMTDEIAGNLVEAIREFSNDCQCNNPIRVFQLSVEKYFM